MASTLSIDHSDPLPLHAQVEKLLRRLVVKSTHARHGKPLPGEVELSNRLGVSRSTVRQAMSKLVAEGLIERRRNAGTRVSAKPLVTSLTDWPSFTAEMSRQGVALRSLHIAAGMERPPNEVANFFQITGRAAPCLLVSRLRGDDDGPIVFFKSYLHPRLKLTPDDDFSGPLYALIERRSSVVPARSAEQIGAIRADAELAEALGCAVNDPVLTRRRRVSDVGRRPVEWCDCFYRADRFTYSIDIQREVIR